MYFQSMAAGMNIVNGINGASNFEKYIFILASEQSSANQRNYFNWNLTVKKKLQQH